MNRKNRMRCALVSVSLGGCLVLGTGCNETVAGEFVSLSGGYLGDLVNVISTEYLAQRLGVEAESGDDGEDEAKALHDYQH